MVKIIVCDRCKKEIVRYNTTNDIFSDLEDCNIGLELFQSQNEGLTISIPQLCDPCESKFKKMVKKFNKEIEEFIDSK